MSVCYHIFDESKKRSDLRRLFLCLKDIRVLPNEHTTTEFFLLSLQFILYLLFRQVFDEHKQQWQLDLNTSDVDTPHTPHTPHIDDNINGVAVVETHVGLDTTTAVITAPTVFITGNETVSSSFAVISDILQPPRTLPRPGMPVQRAVASRYAALPGLESIVTSTDAGFPTLASSSLPMMGLVTPLKPVAMGGVLTGRSKINIFVVCVNWILKLINISNVLTYLIIFRVVW